MPELTIIPDGEGAFPDLRSRPVREARKMAVAGLAHGMSSGNPSVMFRFDYDDGSVGVGQTSLKLLLDAADIMREKYGDPRQEDVGKCAWLMGCGQTVGLMTVRYENVLGEEVQHEFCPTHASLMMDKVVVKALLAAGEPAWRATGSVLTPMELHKHPAQRALQAHCDTCVPCGEERQWTARELQAGHIRTQEDVQRVDAHAREHYCPIGLELVRAVGVAMQGG